MNEPLSPLIHLIDDDLGVRESLALLIGTVGLRTQAWADPQAFLEGFERSSQPTAMALVVLLGSRKRRRRRLTVDSWADVRLLRHTLPCSAA